VGVPRDSTARIVRELASRGYNADREAVTLLAGAPDPERAIERAVEAAPDDTPVLSADHVSNTLETTGHDPNNNQTTSQHPSQNSSRSRSDEDPSVSTGTTRPQSQEVRHDSPVETTGGTGRADASDRASERGRGGASQSTADRNTGGDGARALEVSGDIQSTGTGAYEDFVSVFRDRYERLAGTFDGRLTHRPAASIVDLSDGSQAGLVGMVADINSTSGGHWRIELEDTTGTFPCLVLNDREFADEARNLLCDEVIAVEGTISRDGDDGIMFVDELYVPDVPRRHSPTTADRPVQAALVSDLHVGSQEFRADAWEQFADWLHTPEAERIEYLLIAGDMVEGVGVYPDQDEELDIVDIYDQYERFSERLKDVPGELEIVMIPGNHDAVRLAEPQPAFDDELRAIMRAHDATISANPSTVTVEGVSVLMYHGVSLDEIIAELPDASYDDPAEAMTHLLRKRHVAPQYGGMTRIAPEESDHLVIDEVPDVFHAGHVHKLGYTKYNGVLTVNSGCWQAQTDFQRSVNIEPDSGYAPIVDLDTLDLTVRRFG
jgi:DNA polymerase II small subunit